MSFVVTMQPVWDMEDINVSGTERLILRKNTAVT